MPRHRPSTPARNVCAGRLGVLYDYYIERPALARLVLGLVWGVDSRPFYRSLEVVGRMPDGTTILDVPCGGGVALHGLCSGQRVSWVGVDVEPAMLDRARRRASRFPAVQSCFIEGDMRSLPLDDASADLCLSFGGLHCISDPAKAIAEMARCLRPGTSLVGTTFLARGSRRQQRMLRSEGFGRVGTANELRQWLHDGGFVDVSLDRDDGLAVFGAKRTGAPSAVTGSSATAHRPIGGMPAS